MLYMALAAMKQVTGSIFAWACKRKYDLCFKSAPVATLSAKAHATSTHRPFRVENAFPIAVEDVSANDYSERVSLQAVRAEAVAPWTFYVSSRSMSCRTQEHKDADSLI